MLVDPARLERDYFECRPDLEDPEQRVSFGTSGHRGSAFERSFNEAQMLASVQAVCEYRREHAIAGPLFLGKDTHALSAPAERSALEVLAANGVEALLAGGAGITPVPVVSRALLNHNRNRRGRLADALIATPSHNPPGDGGFKYNPPNGGPADTDVTTWIERRANELLERGNREVRRIAYPAARAAAKRCCGNCGTCSGSTRICLRSTRSRAPTPISPGRRPGPARAASSSAGTSSSPATRSASSRPSARS